MKRDMDLIRKILFEIESEPTRSSGLSIQIPSYSDDEVMYHLVLLQEAGLIDAVTINDRSRAQVYPTRLTWEGHEFLDAARDNTNWNKAKEVMANTGGFVFEVGKQLLIEFVRRQIFPPTP